MMQETREIIFEDGSVAYAAKGHHFAIQAADGGDIPVVEVRQLGNLNERQVARLREKNKSIKGVPRKNGRGWVIREKSLDEQVDEGILTPEQAERKQRERKR